MLGDATRGSWPCYWEQGRWGTLLGAPGLTTRSKKLLGAPGLTTRSDRTLQAPFVGKLLNTSTFDSFDCASQAYANGMSPPRDG